MLFFEDNPGWGFHRAIIPFAECGGCGKIIYMNVYAVAGTYRRKCLSGKPDFEENGFWEAIFSVYAPRLSKLDCFG